MSTHPIVILPISDDNCRGKLEIQAMGERQIDLAKAAIRLHLRQEDAANLHKSWGRALHVDIVLRATGASVGRDCRFAAGQ